jgi:YVTN family beta-propeller protein
MTETNLVQLAQAGNAEAIAILMNATLQAIGVRARVVLREGVLHVLLESERILAKTPCIEFIRRGIARLGLAWLSSAVVYSRVAGQQAPVWVQRIDLGSFSFDNPFFLGDEEVGATTTVVRLPYLRRRQVRLFDLMLLTIPVLVVFTSIQIWSRYLSSYYSTAVNPFAFQSTQDKAPAAAPKQAELNAFDRALQQARKAVKLGETAQSKAEWRQAINEWGGAIALLQSLPKDDSRYASAQEKIQFYQSNIDRLMQDKLSHLGMELKHVIEGGLSPKSIVFSGRDLFFAQNMMYSHTITVYNREYNLVKTISDTVRLADHGYPQFAGEQQGAPVEAAFSQGGEIAWVSNYEMSGAGFNNAADDNCSPAQNLDSSFVYRINTSSLNIDKAIQVGAVPKFLATTGNHRYVLVSNWCSWDVSVIDAQQNKEVRRIQVGPHPRGIAVDRNSEKAYVAVMGSYDVAAIDLKTFEVGWLKDVGHSPRHLNISPDSQYLYATLNGEGQVAKIDLATGTVVAKVITGNAPRSMALSGNGEFLYVVNYDSDTVSKVRTEDMQVVQDVQVNPAPIGITYDPKTNQVWVACYSGSILVFQD